MYGSEIEIKNACLWIRGGPVAQHFANVVTLGEDFEALEDFGENSRLIHIGVVGKLWDLDEVVGFADSFESAVVNEDGVALIPTRTFLLALIDSARM